MAPELLNEARFEAEYGVPKATLRTMRSRGGGPVFTKVGSRVYYRRSDIEAYLAGRKYTSTAQVRAAESGAPQTSMAPPPAAAGSPSPRRRLARKFHRHDPGGA